MQKDTVLLKQEAKKMPSEESGFSRHFSYALAV